MKYIKTFFNKIRKSPKLSDKTSVDIMDDIPKDKLFLEIDETEFDKFKETHKEIYSSYDKTGSDFNKIYDFIKKYQIDILSCDIIKKFLVSTGFEYSYSIGVYKRENIEFGHSIVNKYSYYIYGFEDEWYLVNITSGDKTGRYPNSEKWFFKCDTLDGVKQILLKNSSSLRSTYIY